MEEDFLQTAASLKKEAKHFLELGIGKGSRTLGDLTSLPQNSFDLITVDGSFNDINTIDLWFTNLTNIYNVLEPGGTVLIGVSSGKENGGCGNTKNVLQTEDVHSLNWQLEFAQKNGFANINVLYKKNAGAAWTAVKPAL